MELTRSPSREPTPNLSLPPTGLPREELERTSSAITLTAIELEVFPELVQAQWLANMMSPSLWEWVHNLPKRSGSPTRRKVEAVKQYIIHNYSFTHMEHEPGLCPCGVTDLQTEEARFADSILKREVFDRVRRAFVEGQSTSLAELLGVDDIRTHYGLAEYPRGTIPIWGNEIVEKMDAYARISPDGRGSGKCESLAALYAAALIVVGKFPWQSVSMWFTPAHVMTYLMEGDGYLSSNKRMFSSVSLRNRNEHTAVVKSCLEKEKVIRVQTLFGSIHALLDTYSMAPEAVDELYSHMRRYAASAGIAATGSWPSRAAKRHVPSDWTIDYRGIRSAGDLQQAVTELAAEFPGSPFDLSRYAFRSLDVPHPEVYAYAARRRSPKAAELARRLGRVERIVDYVQKSAWGLDGIFASTERIAMPDEVLIFGRGHHSDRALLLYAMLCALEPDEPEPVVVLTPEESFVWHGGRAVPAEGGAEVGGPIQLAFNSRGSVRSPGLDVREMGSF